MSDEDWKLTIGVDIDTDGVNNGIPKIEKKVLSSIDKLHTSMKEYFVAQAKINKAYFESMGQSSDKIFKKTDSNSTKTANKFSAFLSRTSSNFKSFFQENGKQLDHFVNNSFNGLSKVAGLLGIGLTAGTVFTTINTNAQLGYKSGGLNTNVQPLSSLEQGGRQVGINPDEMDKIIGTIAQLQTDQNGDAITASRAIQTFNTIDSLMGISHQNQDKTDKKADEYLKDILQSPKFKAKTEMAQEAFLQKVFGVSTVTAHQLISKDFLPKVEEARKTTATTEQEAEEAKRADQTLARGKNYLFKFIASSIEAIEGVWDLGITSTAEENAKIASMEDLSPGQHKKEYNQYYEKWANEHILNPNNKISLTGDNKTSSDTEQNQAVTEKEFINSLIMNESLAKAQQNKESNFNNYAVGSKGELGAFQIMPQLLKDRQFQKDIGIEHLADKDLFDYNINRKVRDYLLEQNIKSAINYDRKHNIPLRQGDILGRALAQYNGGAKGVERYDSTHESYNHYAEDIMHSSEVNLTQHITINGVDTKDATNIVKEIKNANKQEWLPLQINNIKGFKN